MELDEEIRDLLTRGAGHDKAPAMHMLVDLLGYLGKKRHDFFRDEYRVELPADEIQIQRFHDECLSEVFRGRLRLRHSRFNLEVIVRWFADLPDEVELTGPRQARLLALALERKMGDQIWEELLAYYGPSFDGDDRCKIEAGQPVPVSEAPFGFDVTVQETNPRRLPRWRTPARTKRIMLAPDKGPYTIRLNRSLSDELHGIKLTPSLRIATIHPFNSLDDVDTNPDRQRWKFGPVIPKASDNIDRIIAGIKIACREEAQVVVLPELCSTETEQVQITEAWDRARGDRSAILVGGSYHARATGTDEPYRNELRLYGTSSDTALVPKVDKKIPFIWGRRWSSDHQRYFDEMDLDERTQVESEAVKWPRHDYLERVPYRSKPVIDIFCSRSLTLAVVICADFLDDGIRDLIRDLDVDLVVIPSMSDRSRIFERLIVGHVAATRSIVVYANAFFSDPRERRHLNDPTTLSSRGYIRRSGRDPERWRLDETFSPDIAQPGVAVINICKDDDVAWYPLATAEVNAG